MKREGLAPPDCIVAVLLSGCIATGQDSVSIPLRIAGSGEGAPVEGRDGFVIDLAEASLVFGPLYVCAGALAGDNCETARLEWLDAVVVDVLDPIGVEVGQLTGFTGPVRSAMYDFGITSLLTGPRPVALAAVDTLGGNSVRLGGTATRGEESVPFQIAFPIRSGSESQIGVSVVRVSDAGDLEHEVTGDEPELVVRFDASSWVRDVDFALGLTAVAGAGELPAGEGSQAERAVAAAMLLGQRARFEWGAAP
jgi:hypothetical protein